MAGTAEDEIKDRLKNLTVKELQARLRDRQLKIAGNKAVLIERLVEFLKSNSQQANDNDESTNPEEEIDNDESTNQPEEEIEATVEALKKLTLPQLKARLKARRLKLSGNKDELISRLLDPNAEEKAPKKWVKSTARKLLVFDISRGKDLHEGGQPKSATEVYQMRDEFQRYNFQRFKGYLAKLRQVICSAKAQAVIDDGQVETQLQSFPFAGDTYWGYPSWRSHPAKHLLRMDMDDDRHKTMFPCELWATRMEYQEFPLHVFRQRIAQEGKALKQANLNAAREFEEEDDSEGEEEYLYH
jgi:hypothetical protein